MGQQAVRAPLSGVPMHSSASRLRFRASLALGLLFLTLSILTTTRRGAADPQKFVEIHYEGELRDASNKPIAGVYPLEFALYPSEKASKSIWTETHWVAVEGGAYQLKLGTTKRIRSGLAKEGQTVSLGVSLRGAGELVRDAIVFPSAKAETKTKAEAEPTGGAAKIGEAAVPDADVADPAVKPIYKMESSFAEVAEYAKRAGVAENSDKFGGHDFDELQSQIDSLGTQLSEHRTDARLHGGGGLAEDTRTLPRVGGKGGQRYERKCPDGYVVTGIRGAAGALVDSFEVICTRLK